MKKKHNKVPSIKNKSIKEIITILEDMGIRNDDIICKFSSTAIKISKLKTPILFIIVNNNTITNIDICYNDCYIAKILTPKSAQLLKLELNKFIDVSLLK